MTMSIRTLALGALLALATMGGAVAQSDKSATAVFASGCFWCTQSDFEKVPGVIKVVSGYTGGQNTNPTYGEVSSGSTGHREAAMVTYDPAKVSYERLLDVFWHNVDPFDPRGQFCDKGSQYLGGIFYRNDEERQLAEAAKKKVEERFGKSAVTSILPATAFYPAEDYHQDYHISHATQYRFYRFNCGRDQRLEQLWGKGKSS